MASLRLAIVALSVTTLAGCPRVGLEVPVDGTVVVSPDEAVVVDGSMPGDLPVQMDSADGGGASAEGGVRRDLSTDDLTVAPRDSATGTPVDIGCGGKPCNLGEVCDPSNRCMSCAPPPVVLKNITVKPGAVPDVATHGKGLFAAVVAPTVTANMFGAGFFEKDRSMGAEFNSGRQAIAARVASNGSTTLALLLAQKAPASFIEVTGDAVMGPAVKPMSPTDLDCPKTGSTATGVGDVACGTDGCRAVFACASPTGGTSNHEVVTTSLPVLASGVTSASGGGAISALRLSAQGTNLWTAIVSDSGALGGRLARVRTPMGSAFDLVVKNCDEGTVLGFESAPLKSEALLATVDVTQELWQMPVTINPMGSAIGGNMTSVSAVADAAPAGVAATGSGYVLSFAKDGVRLARAGSMAPPQLQVTSDASDRAPQVAYDASSGSLGVAWVRGNQLMAAVVPAACVQ